MVTAGVIRAAWRPLRVAVEVAMILGSPATVGWGHEASYPHVVFGWM